MNRKEFEEIKARDGYVLDDSMHYYEDWAEYKKRHPFTSEEGERECAQKSRLSE